MAWSSQHCHLYSTRNKYEQQYTVDTAVQSRYSKKTRARLEAAQTLRPKSFSPETGHCTPSKSMEIFHCEIPTAPFVGIHHHAVCLSTPLFSRSFFSITERSLPTNETVYQSEMTWRYAYQVNKLTRQSSDGRFCLVLSRASCRHLLLNILHMTSDLDHKCSLYYPIFAAGSVDCLCSADSWMVQPSDPTYSCNPRE